MIKAPFILALCICYSTSIVSAQDATSYGQVAGSVVFANGKPAPGMMILLEEINSQFSIRSITDQDGHYSIPNLPTGDYVIYPFGTYDQYPLRHDMFLDEHPDRFRINVDGAWITENLVMPPEAATFFGTIVDGQGNAIPDAQIVLCHADEVWRSAEIHSDASGQFRYVVPTDENLSVFVHAQTLDPVQHTGIIFAPGEKRHMVIRLGESKHQDALVKEKTCKPFRPSV